MTVAGSDHWNRSALNCFIERCFRNARLFDPRFGCLEFTNVRANGEGGARACKDDAPGAVLQVHDLEKRSELATRVHGEDSKRLGNDTYEDDAGGSQGCLKGVIAEEDVRHCLSLD
jgi:hypothetical protein